MLKKERQAHILHQVNLHNKVLSADLCINMQVSEDTIRRDLLELSDLGQVIKIHGGALSSSFHTSLEQTPVYSQDKKRIVAQKALDFIKPGMVILSTGGTTIIELAKLLPNDLQVTFITGSLPAAMAYIKHPLVELIFIGDKVSRTSLISVGGEAISKIKEIKADLCLFGINAIDAEHGISDNDWDVVQVKKAMIESAKKVIALTISEKVNTLNRITICDISKVNILITELNPDTPLLEPYRKAGVQVV